VCVGGATKLRSFDASGQLQPLEWSVLQAGDLLHLQLDRTYLPSNPPVVVGRDVVLVARETGS
jgi:hypothetical protein